MNVKSLQWSYGYGFDQNDVDPEEITATTIAELNEVILDAYETAADFVLSSYEEEIIEGLGEEDGDEASISVTLYDEQGSIIEIEYDPIILADGQVITKKDKSHPKHINFSLDKYLKEHLPGYN